MAALAADQLRHGCGTRDVAVLAGSTDTTVDPGNTLRLAATLRAAGDHVTATIYPSVGHVTLIGAFGPALGLFGADTPRRARFTFASQSPAGG